MQKPIDFWFLCSIELYLLSELLKVTKIIILKNYVFIYLLGEWSPVNFLVLLLKKFFFLKRHGDIMHIPHNLPPKVCYAMVFSILTHIKKHYFSPFF